MTTLEKFKLWLRAANAYYFYNEDEGTLMEDYQWDALARELQREWDSFDHPLKHRFEVDGQPQLHSAFHLSIEDYRNV